MKYYLLISVFCIFSICASDNNPTSESEYVSKELFVNLSATVIQDKTIINKLAEDVGELNGKLKKLEGKNSLNIDNDLSKEINTLKTSIEDFTTRLTALENLAKQKKIGNYFPQLTNGKNAFIFVNLGIALFVYGIRQSVEVDNKRATFSILKNILAPINGVIAFVYGLTFLS